MKKLKPYQCKTDAQLLALNQDQVETKSSWMLLNYPLGVCICNQKLGEELTGQITLTRKEAIKFFCWYLGLDAKRFK
jgi:hypothetical protein